MDKISLIIPCYNEEQAIPYLFEELNRVAEIMEHQLFEYIFINDGSKDKTLSVVKQLYNNDKRIRFISFSRNFGKEAAILAGLKASTGDFIAMIDADLQDPPGLLVKMYNSLKKEDYDCVATYRVSRKGEPPIRSYCAKKFYQLINRISDVKLVDGARDFRLMTRQMVNAILELSEYNRFSKGIFQWIGFNTKWIPFENIERVAGTTKWSFISLFFYSLEGIVAFSTRPLSIASLFGILFCIISLIMVCAIIAKTLIWGDPVAGYPSTVCIIFFIGGIQLFCLGILGQYLSKTYLETKRRPIFIIKETEDGQPESKMA